MLYGGFATQADACSGDTCDGMPSPWENWTQIHDSHGCAIWIEPTEYLDCCGCEPRDAG
jgi:hypothetical protein